MTTGLDGLEIPFNNAYDDEPEYLYSTMVFQQSFAPVGWRKKTDFTTDSALRVVNAWPATPDKTNGNPFSNTFVPISVNSGTNVPITLNTDNKITTINEMQAHTHSFGTSGTFGSLGMSFPAAYSPGGIYYSTSPSGTTASISIGSPSVASSPTGHAHSISGSLYTVSASTTNVNFSIKYIDSILATRYFRGPD
jgi:hypothetical protein